jgi:hypothetical protein
MVTVKFKETALGTGQKAVRLVKLLVLAFWVGGGAVAGLIVPFSIFGKDPGVVGVVLGWFSWCQLGLGALAVALMIAIDRARRVSMGVFLSLLILLGVDLFGLQSWMTAQGPGTNAYRAYWIIFFGAWLVALIHFLATAASSAEYRPLPVKSQPPEPELARAPARPQPAAPPVRRLPARAPAPDEGAAE